MKWFKHDSDAGNDPRLKKLKKKFGLEGYGLYFNTLELMCRKLEADLDNIGFLPDEWDLESLEIEFGISPDSIGTMYDYMVSIGLFQRVEGKLYNDHIQDRCDEYTSRIIKGRVHNSRQTPDKIGTKTDIVSPRLDKIRLEENINNNGSAEAPLVKKNETMRTNSGFAPIGDLIGLKVNPIQTPQKSGVYTEWQEKALRYSKDLNLVLAPHAMGRWMKIFKQASLGRNTANIDKAYSFIIDYPKPLNNEQKMMFFFKIYERGLDWMQKEVSNSGN
jgi:hypothetical protein